MDIDTKPLVNSQRASPADYAFSTAFPLPYRIFFLIGAGILAWASNLHFLQALGIDTAYALDIRRGTHQNNGHSSPLPQGARPTSFMNNLAHPSTLHRPIYRTFVLYALTCTASWLLYHVASSEVISVRQAPKTIPGLTAIFLIALLVCPWNVANRIERSTVLSATWRCIFPKDRVYFSDVVLADVFTSYAKVIGDVWIALQMLLPGGTLGLWPNEQGLRRWIVPCLMSIPYFIRFRQCIKEYKDSEGLATRSMWNAIKYASAFPVIFLSAAQKYILERPTTSTKNSTDQVWYGEHQLFRLWLLSVFINSMYSFWWDVSNDWGLELLRPSYWSHSSAVGPQSRNGLPRQLVLPALQSGKFKSQSIIDLASPPNGLTEERPSHPIGLRSRLLFGDSIIYYIAIALNFILRFTWSLKLSSHLHNVADMESGVFVMELLEVLRRWVWVFIRIEWETQRLRMVSSPEMREAEDSLELL